MKQVKIQFVVILLITSSFKADFAGRPNQIISNVFPIDVKVNNISSKCEPSVTTLSGRYLPNGPVCKNQLILNEEFNSFNQNFWQHEENLNGGGVSIFKYKKKTLDLRRFF